MRKISNLTTVASKPTPVSSGSVGWFTNGNIATSTPATYLNAEWCNQVQAELVNAATSLGAEESLTDDTQLARAIGQSSDNIAINGGMRVSQRGTSFLGLTAAGASYTADRWKFAGGGTITGNVTIGAAGIPSNLDPFQAPATALHFALTNTPTLGVMDEFYIAQIFTGLSVAPLLKSSSGLSFLIRSPTTGTFSVCLYATSGAASIVLPYTITAANTWQRIYIDNIPPLSVGTFSTNNTASVGLVFTFGAGTNRRTSTTGVWQTGVFTQATASPSMLVNAGDTVAITGVSWTAGKYAVPYSDRPYVDEWLDCRHYYQQHACLPASVYSHAAAATGLQMYSRQLLPTMRSTPAGAILSAPAYTNASALAISNISASEFRATVTGTAVGLSAVTSGATFEFSAEM